MLDHPVISADGHIDLPLEGNTYVVTSEAPDRITDRRRIERYELALRRLAERHLSLFQERAEITFTVGGPDGQDAVLDKGIEVALNQLANPSATFPPPPSAPPPTPAPSPAALTDGSVVKVALAAPFVLG